MKNENFKSRQKTKIIRIKIAKVICIILMALLSIEIAIEDSGYYFDSFGNYVEKESNFAKAALLTLLGYWLIKRIFDPIIKKQDPFQGKFIVKKAKNNICNGIIKIIYIFIFLSISYSLLFSFANTPTETIILLLFSIINIILINQIIILNLQLEETKSEIVFKKNLIYTIIFSVINIVGIWGVLLMIPQYSFLSRTKKTLQSKEPIVGQTENNVGMTFDKKNNDNPNYITQTANILNKKWNKKMILIIGIFIVGIIIALVNYKMKQNDAIARFNLGVMYYKGTGAVVDKEQAFYWFEKSAKQGYALSQYYLGLMYYYGDGTLMDKKQAFYWYKKSAEQGNAEAQCNLGYMYENGEGTLMDKKQVFYWYKKSAEQGLAEAQYNLGHMYYFGEGTLMDKKQAFYWYKKSAEQGYAKAQYNLGVMYHFGEGTLMDKKQAFYWLKKSAEQGNAVAQYNLGQMYYFGEGTLMDKKQAAYWVRKSYENGCEEAKDVWDELELYKY